MKRYPKTVALHLLAVLSSFANASQLNLEIQSNCLEIEELDEVFGEEVFAKLHGLTLQEAVPISSSRAQPIRNGPPKITSAFTFEAYTISTGSNRWLELEPASNSSSVRGPRLDCPTVRECPCNGCPGHWCLMLCGFVKPNRRFVRQRSLTGVATGLGAEDSPQESLLCDAVGSLLSSPNILNTCLQEVSILRCALS